MAHDAGRNGRSDFVRFAGLSVEYSSSDGPVQALSDVELSFGQGEFVCIVGPSGCGKTTLMHALGGFIRPTHGEVTMEGQPIRAPGPDRGLVFQQPTLFPWLSVSRNASFGPRMRKFDRAATAQTVEQWLRQTGLWEFRNRYPYELSGGMRQRLAIVRALVNEPRILLMDEPFGALDALTREKMQEMLHAIWRRSGMTVVFITHSVEEAVYLGTRVVVMSRRPGRIIEDIAAPFARRSTSDGMRSVKASTDFIALREHVLSLIWRSGDDDVG